MTNIPAEDEQQLLTEREVGRLAALPPDTVSEEPWRSGLGAADGNSPRPIPALPTSAFSKPRFVPERKHSAAGYKYRHRRPRPDSA